MFYGFIFGCGNCPPCPAASPLLRHQPLCFITLFHSMSKLMGHYETGRIIFEQFPKTNWILFIVIVSSPRPHVLDLNVFLTVCSTILHHSDVGFNFSLIWIWFRSWNYVPWLVVAAKGKKPSGTRGRNYAEIHNRAPLFLTVPYVIQIWKENGLFADSSWFCHLAEYFFLYIWSINIIKSMII